MKLLLKQRMWSWFDSFDIYYENGETCFTVKGQPSWSHMFRIYNKNGEEVASLKQKVWSWTPRFYAFDTMGNRIGDVHQQFTFIHPKFDMRMNGKEYRMEGNWVGWDYRLYRNEELVATITKEVLNWTDTYSIEVDEKDALTAVLIVLAIDAIKCNQARTVYVSN